jgi:hypothetical protein
MSFVVFMKNFLIYSGFHKSKTSAKTKKKKGRKQAKNSQ